MSKTQTTPAKPAKKTDLLSGRTRRNASKPQATTMFEIARSQELTLAGEKAHLWLAIDVVAPKKAVTKRPPADFAAVLDCSGSMGSGPGSASAKAGDAARYVFERLGGSDRSALVLYGDTVRIAAELGSGHQAAAALTRSLPSLGFTALADGLYAGVEQLGGGKSAKRTRQVFLLSDGLANVGETDPKRIAAKVRKAAKAGIKVSTFGLGAHYDEDLLEALAVAGGGGYHYLADVDDAPVAFAEELAELFTLAIRSAALELRPAKGVEVTRMLGFADDPKQRTVDAGDLAAGARRTLLIELRLDKKLADGDALLEVSLSGQDAAGKALTGGTEKLVVSSSSDATAVSDSVSETVMARVAETGSRRRPAQGSAPGRCRRLRRCRGSPDPDRRLDAGRGRGHARGRRQRRLRRQAGRAQHQLSRGRRRGPDLLTLCGQGDEVKRLSDQPLARPTQPWRRSGCQGGLVSDQQQNARIRPLMPGRSCHLRIAPRPHRGCNLAISTELPPLAEVLEMLDELGAFGALGRGRSCRAGPGRRWLSVVWAGGDPFRNLSALGRGRLLPQRQRQVGQAAPAGSGAGEILVSDGDGLITSIDEFERRYLSELHLRRRWERLPDDLWVYAKLFGLGQAEELAAQRPLPCFPISGSTRIRSRA